jgi:hypothetical protein
MFLAFETPTPEGHKRCMTCWETMPPDEYCDCLKAIGKDIVKKAMSSLANEPPRKPRAEKKQKDGYGDNQGRLFQ